MKLNGLTGSIVALITPFHEDGSVNFHKLGELVEFDDTEQMFSVPKDRRTEDYITGRFG